MADLKGEEDATLYFLLGERYHFLDICHKVVY